MDSFSSSGEQAIRKTVDVVPESIAAGDVDLETGYEIAETAECIIQNEFNCITLQFPDELLHDSAPVHQSLKSRLPPGKKLFILADTTYGSCCVDEVAAAHVNADVVVHYGHTCLSRTSRLPAIYVFGKKPLRPDHCAQTLLDATEPSHVNRKHIILFHDVAYTHRIDDVYSRLRESKGDHTIHFKPIGVRLVPPQRSSDDDQDQKSAGLTHTLSLPAEFNADDSIILYVGGESLGLNNILLSHANVPTYSYDPATGTARLESDRSNKLLMRRYAVMQRARDADVFGILVGTLGVASYLPLIKHLRSRITKARRKAYTLAVGKLNPAKLANFPEIECFVLVACPENSIVESKEFSKPIVTPYELELALQPEPTWTGKVVLDFSQVMADRPQPANADIDDDDDPDRPRFSLTTGKYRDSKYRHSTELEDPTPSSDVPSDQVAVRNKNTAVAARDTGTIGEYLQARSWKGLEPRYGQDEPSGLLKGRTGIAKGYDDDHGPSPPPTSPVNLDAE